MSEGCMTVLLPVGGEGLRSRASLADDSLESMASLRRSQQSLERALQRRLLAVRAVCCQECAAPSDWRRLLMQGRAVADIGRQRGGCADTRECVTQGHGHGC